MSQQKWDEILIAEHELIERAMAVLKNQLGALGGGEGAGEVNRVRLERAVDFLLEFGDKMHNLKEEEVLFPLMIERGIPEQGPIGVMLAEHEAERTLLAEMGAQLAGLVDAPDPDKLAFRDRGLEYLKVRAEHIWKENDVLYMMGRRAFSEADNEHLVGEFARINREHYGENARELLAKMVEEIEGEAGRTQLIRNLSYAQIDAIMEALPVEVTYVAADDAVAYFNRLDKEKIFPRTRSAIGRKVDKCHPEHSVPLVLEIVDAFKKGTRDVAEFWIDFKGDKVLIQYFAVRNDTGEYMGVMEITQGVNKYKKIKGQKILLDDAKAK